MEDEKAKREREMNWDRAEKEMLRQLVDCKLEVIEDKSNDLKMIAKKKSAWEAVRAGMIAAGYNRTSVKIKQQWSRMKIAAKKARTKLKKAVKATGNMVSIPDSDPSDTLVQAMISNQLVDDTVHIDSNTVISPVHSIFSADQACISSYNQRVCESVGTSNFNTSSALEDYIDCEEIHEHQPTITTITSSCEVSNPAYKPSDSEPVPKQNNLLSSLRQLPKKQASKGQVMSARQQQINNATSSAEELHVLQVEHAKQVLLLDKELLKQAKEATAHAREKHNLELQLMKEYYMKKMEAI